MKAWTWAVLAVAVACPAALASDDANELSYKERRDARKIYVAKCAKCHRFYEAKDYSSPAWAQWMESMSEKSKLKPRQRELLERYLDEYRNGKLPGKPQDKTKTKDP